MGSDSGENDEKRKQSFIRRLFSAVVPDDEKPPHKVYLIQTH
jgi:hypothetical protein